MSDSYASMSSQQFATHGVGKVVFLQYSVPATYVAVKSFFSCCVSYHYGSLVS